MKNSIHLAFLLLFIFNSLKAQDLKTIAALAAVGEWEKVATLADGYLQENKDRLPGREMANSKETGKPIAEFYFIQMYRTLVDVGQDNEKAFKEQMKMIDDAKDKYEGTTIGNGILLGLTSTLGGNWKTNEVYQYSEAMYKMAFENEKKWSAKPLNMKFLYAFALSNSKKYNEAILLYKDYLANKDQVIKDGGYKFVIGSIFGLIDCYDEIKDMDKAHATIKAGIIVAGENNDADSKDKLLEMQRAFK